MLQVRFEQGPLGMTASLSLRIDRTSNPEKELCTLTSHIYASKIKNSQFRDVSDHVNLNSPLLKPRSAPQFIAASSGPEYVTITRTSHQASTDQQSAEASVFLQTEALLSLDSPQCHKPSTSQFQNHSRNPLT